jgi:thiol-disulfide isomerase/thioredoxin
MVVSGRIVVAVASMALAFGVGGVSPAAAQVVRADLKYAAPGTGPAPNFSPKGTQVALADAPAGFPLPEGASRPAKTGTMKIGPGESARMRILVTAEAAHPNDLCRVYLDRNRNGDFADDGPALAATPTLNQKTGAWWSSFANAEIQVPYGRGPQGERIEPYLVTFWAVREGDSVPDIIRYSVRSWRSGKFTINGVEALVAAMDGNNDAVFDKDDMWSVIEASAPDAPKRVLSIDEARTTERLMFVKTGGKELVLQFQSFSPDGRSVSFAVVDRPVTKAEDRAGDDTVAAERGRPRTKTPFPWEKNLDAALARAKDTGRKVIVDFWTTWCGPCAAMDQWVWTDSEVAALLGAGYIGVKLDGDVEKALVKRFAVTGYPTVLLLDPSSREVGRLVGYGSSKQVLELLAAKR